MEKFVRDDQLVCSIPSAKMHPFFVESSLFCNPESKKSQVDDSGSCSDIYLG